jgi:basic membrane lipoprotein Med (substrate-binding protein (PBP1-ABC) superfamily)
LSADKLARSDAVPAATVLVVLIGLGSLVTSGGCSLLVPSNIVGHGIGEVCAVDTDCHAGVCEQGSCTASCGGSGDCPAPSACYANRCRLPIHVGAVLSESAQPPAGWSFEQAAGLAATATTDPYISTQIVDNITPNEGKVTGAVDSLVGAGATFVVADSPGLAPEILGQANNYPKVTFLTYTNTPSTYGSNDSTFSAKLEEAWFVAGQVAGKKAKLRIGIIGGLISPESVRMINAFLLGARKVNPAIVAEVKWLGYWFDYNPNPMFAYGGETLYREELLASQLVDSHCEIVAHVLHNQRAVARIDKLAANGHSVRSMSNIDPAGCTPHPNGQPLGSCLGGVALDWSVMYAQVFDQVQRRVWDSTPLVLRLSVEGVGVLYYHRNAAVDSDQTSASTAITSVLSSMPGQIFEGQYDVTGQFPGTNQSVGAGVIPEVDNMCWFAKGVVEKTDPNDPTSPDRDALVPDPMHAAPAGAMPPPDEPVTGLSCPDNQMR